MRQSRYQGFNSMAFMADVNQVLFGPAFRHLDQLLKQIQQQHGELTRTTAGFAYDDRYFPTRQGVKFHTLKELHEDLHERMGDYLQLLHTFEQERHLVASWYRNMLARCKTLEQVKACLMPQVIGAIQADLPGHDLGSASPAETVMYASDPTVENLQLKYIGFRFIFS